MKHIMAAMAALTLAACGTNGPPPATWNNYHDKPVAQGAPAKTPDAPASAQPAAPNPASEKPGTKPPAGFTKPAPGTKPPAQRPSGFTKPAGGPGFFK